MEDGTEEEIQSELEADMAEIELMEIERNKKWRKIMGTEPPWLWKFIKFSSNIIFQTENKKTRIFQIEKLFLYNIENMTFVVKKTVFLFLTVLSFIFA